MANPAKSAAGKADAVVSLALTRTFDASPEAVFKAWTDPAQIGRWIGPRSVTANVEKLEARKGGAYRIKMLRDTGQTPIVEGVYREFDPGKRLSFTWAWLDEAGKPGHETLVTLEFRGVGEKTQMTMRHERFATAETPHSHNQGWVGA